MANCPERAGYYDRGELYRLSSGVGFPGRFLIDGLENAPSLHLQAAFQNISRTKVSDKIIKSLLESKHMQKRLHKYFNSSPEDHNKKIFMKAMSVLRHRKLDFSEISVARVSYDLYASEDGGGMLASASVVLQALELIGRAISPVKLRLEIQKQQDVVDIPSRIQLYEYIDLVCKSVRISDVEREMDSLIPRDGEISIDLQDSSIPDFDWILMTNSERILAYLDKQYHNTQFKEAASTPPSSDTDNILFASRLSRMERTAESQRQIRSLTPVLECSQHQVLKACNGFMVLTKEQHQSVDSLHSSRQNSRVGRRSDVKSGGRRSNGSSVEYSQKPQESLPVPTGGSKLRPVSHRKERMSPPSLQPPPSAISAAGKSRPEAKYLLRSSKSAPILPLLRAHGHNRKTEVTMRDATKSTSMLPRGKGETQTRRGQDYSSFQPVVTEQDILRHSGRMYELEWEELRKKWQQPPTNKIEYRQ